VISRAPAFCLSSSVAFFSLLSLFVPGSFGQTLQHRYSFNGNVNDSVGGANGTLVGNAYITNNTLVLPGGGNSDNPSGYVNLPNGIVTNCTSITVEAWVTDVAGSTWAEAWCFGDTAAGPGNPPTSGTAYISLIPHSGEDDFRAAFNLTGSDEIDVIDTAGPLPLNTEEYAVVTYDAPSTTARLYLNGTQVATASIPTNLAPSNFGNTYNNWFGRDEWGGDPMFAGSLDEVRIWNGAVSPLYISLSALAGPGVVLTNLTPGAVAVSVNDTSLAVGAPEQAAATVTFSQLTNIFIVTTSVTNWVSSNPSVLTVGSNGLRTSHVSRCFGHQRRDYSDVASRWKRDSGLLAI
jgi:Concanavalin A-like lectin/glucanases superfamily